MSVMLGDVVASMLGEIGVWVVVDESSHPQTAKIRNGMSRPCVPLFMLNLSLPD